MRLIDAEHVADVALLGALERLSHACGFEKKPSGLSGCSRARWEFKTQFFFESMPAFSMKTANANQAVSYGKGGYGKGGYGKGGQIAKRHAREREEQKGMHLTRGGSRNFFLAAGSLRSSASLLPAMRIFLYNLADFTCHRLVIMLIHSRNLTVTPRSLTYAMHKNREAHPNLLVLYPLNEKK